MSLLIWLKVGIDKDIDEFSGYLNRGESVIGGSEMHQLSQEALK